MADFNVLPIPNDVAKRIRETRIDDYGHQLKVSVATENDTGPCRSCLTVFQPGQGRLLFSYAPNECEHPYNEIGPIYIHEQECKPYSQYDAFPSDLRTRRPLVLRFYDTGGNLIGGELVGERPVEDVITTAFDDEQVKYLHARTATVGCFIARIERPESY
jgi:Protein of unknown function (DUF1203)